MAILLQITTTTCRNTTATAIIDQEKLYQKSCKVQVSFSKVANKNVILVSLSALNLLLLLLLLPSGGIHFNYFKDSRFSPWSAMPPILYHATLLWKTLLLWHRSCFFRRMRDYFIYGLVVIGSLHHVIAELTKSLVLIQQLQWLSCWYHEIFCTDIRLSRF